MGVNKKSKSSHEKDSTPPRKSRGTLNGRFDQDGVGAEQTLVDGGY